MDITQIVLEASDQERFKNWLNLNINSITWEGRYLEDFNVVWTMIFENNIKLSTQFYQLDNVMKILSQGPVISWFKWLKIKLICYAFVKRNLSLKDIAELSSQELPEIASMLRDFFVEQFPEHEEQLNELFQLNSWKSIDNDFRFNDIGFLLEKKEMIGGSTEEDVLRDLEVTLYSDWESLKNIIYKKKEKELNNDIGLLSTRRNKKKVKFIRELVLLFLIGGVIIFSIKVGNKAYEDYLVKKISLFSPQFFWLDKTLSFKRDLLESKKIDIKLDELDKLEKIESKLNIEDDLSIRRYDVESDVVLTSVESLPKDFSIANQEQSNYEEKRKGGYRDSRYGRRRAFRVMMTSIDPKLTKSRVLNFLKNYKIEQVDNVKPGTEIPGGVYFNLYVPSKNMKEFLSRVVTIEDGATILESKTRFGGKKGMNKVFIWIKNI